MSDAPQLLALGSAVKIDDDDDTYIIIARGFQKSAKGFLAGYKVVPHPQGAAAGVNGIVVRQPQITKVVHAGYENADDRVFAETQLENAKAPPVAPPAPLADPSSPAPVAPQQVSNEGASSRVPSNPSDPFSELRTKGKRI